jgi:acyl-CoA dehydrogenase
MEILTYSKEHLEFRKRIQTFLAREVTPFVDGWEKDHRVPKSVWRKMGREGFLCMNISPEYGGEGKDFLYSVMVTEEIIKTNHSGLAAPLHTDIVVPYIDAFGSEELKKKYLPGCISGDIITAIAMTEPDAGSDLAAMKTTAVEDGDHVVINGAKTFITNGLNSELVIVAAVDPSVENSYEAISLYLIEEGTTGFKRGKRLEKMGLHSQDTAELFFTECRVPKKNRLGGKGTGFLMLMEKLQQERIVCAIMAQAAAESILEWTTDYCRSHPPNQKPISKSQAAQFALVEMTTEAKLGRTFLDKLIADHMEKKNVIVETSMAKYWITDMVNRTANRSLDLMGDAGNLETYPVIRALRDVRVMSIFAGTNEIMKGICAKFMGL